MVWQLTLHWVSQLSVYFFCLQFFVYIFSAMINHSCDSNYGRVWKLDENLVVAYATRPIKVIQFYYQNNLNYYIKVRYFLKNSVFFCLFGDFFLNLEASDWLTQKPPIFKNFCQKGQNIIWWDFLKLLTFRARIVYFIEGKTPSRHKYGGLAFSKFLNGTFPWRIYTIKVFGKLSQKRRSVFVTLLI